jgi:hypothetical protein
VTRVALISDVRGNGAALEAVLADIGPGHVGRRIAWRNAEATPQVIVKDADLLATP